MNRETATLPENLAEPEVRRRRVSPIWALPIVALIVAAWLGYTTFAEKGPTITITFKTAAGLEAGKTRIKHHDIELGAVQRVEPSADLSHVIVTAQMSKMAAEHLNERTNFWVVRPRLSITSLSGLETLVSGAYIEMDPGAGPITHKFVGLEEPPVIRSDVQGTTFVLTANKIGSLDSGSPVFFRGMAVGEVIGYSFGGLDKPSTVRIFVRKPYDGFVRESTRFWNASGVTVSAGASGFKFEVESLEAVLAGGVAFDTAAAASKEEAAKADSTFELYSDHGAAEVAGFTRRARLMVKFDGSVRGLEVGAPVALRGITIGRVVDINLVVDAARSAAEVPVVLELDLERIGIVNQPEGEIGKGGLAEKLVALGMRAQLRTASLITGQLFVAFDFFPDAPPATIVKTDGYPEVPTVPSTMEDITRSIGQVLDKLAALPLDEVMGDLRNTLAAAEQMLRNADSRSASLITSLRQASEAADMVLKSVGTGYGGTSQIRAELSDLLRQLQQSARSVRLLADFLEQHPDSLIRGKTGGQ